MSCRYWELQCLAIKAIKERREAGMKVHGFFVLPEDYDEIMRWSDADSSDFDLNLWMSTDRGLDESVVPPPPVFMNKYILKSNSPQIEAEKYSLRFKQLWIPLIIHEPKDIQAIKNAAYEAFALMQLELEQDDGGYPTLLLQKAVDLLNACFQEWGINEIARIIEDEKD